MSLKKNLSSAAIFGSVFLGSIISEGLHIITSPNSIKDLFKKLNGSLDIAKESLKEKIDDATIILIENSALTIIKTKMKIDTVSSVLSRYKEKTRKIESNSGLEVDSGINIPKLNLIDNIKEQTEPIGLEINPEIKPKTIKNKTASFDSSIAAVSISSQPDKKTKTKDVKTKKNSLSKKFS